jgi:3-oxoacyl-[acyl-carrier protein] reductase
MFDFNGKTAIVTGAGSGIGRATALYFHACGANVVLADINAEAVKAVANEVDPDGGRVLPLRYDAASAESAAEVVNAAVAQFGDIDQVVCCAGIYQSQPFLEMTEEAWRRVMAINLDGIFFLLRNAAPRMREGGAIALIASVAAHTGGTPGQVHYGASKGGVLALARGLSRELAPRLRVNAISPGLIETPMVDQFIASPAGQQVLNAISLRRYGKPSEIASVAAFLCSEAAGFVTGETIIVSGGAYMG